MRAYCHARNLDLQHIGVEERRGEFEKFAAQLMRSVAALVPALPIPIAAGTLPSGGPDGITATDWKAAFYRRAEELGKRNALVVVPRRTREHTFETAVAMLRLRRLVAENGGVCRPAPGAENMLAYYANSITTEQETA